MSGSRKIRATSINCTPLFSKNKLHTFLGGFFFDLGVKSLYILDLWIHGNIINIKKYEIRRAVT